MLDVAVVDVPEVNDAAAVARAQIPAHPVVVELVVVGAGAEGRTAAPASVAENNSSPMEELFVIVVVVYVHVHLQAVRQC